jgi:hypothetical protein
MEESKERGNLLSVIYLLRGQTSFKFNKLDEAVIGKKKITN